MPTRDAVLDLVREFGYSAAVLRPHFSDYTGAETYRTGGARAFLCSKQTELSLLDADVEMKGRRNSLRNAFWFAAEKMPRFSRTNA